MTGESTPLEGAAVADSTVTDPVCPYLGMVGDPRGHHTFPSRLHLCQAGEPAHIGLGFQADYCLGGAYPSCARYQRAQEAVAAGQPVYAGADGAALAAAAPLTPLASPGGGNLGRVRSPDERRGSPLVSILLALALLTTVVAFAIAAGIIRLPTSGPIAVGTTPPVATATASVATTGSPVPSPSAVPTASVVPTPSPTPASGEITHVVQPGETLTSISLLYSVPITDIVVRNGLANPDAIQIGQTLIIPVGGLPSPSITPTPAVTGSPGESPVATSFIYVVQFGDSLFEIAIRFGVTQQAILDANPEITDPNQIFPGQEIIIPAP